MAEFTLRTMFILGVAFQAATGMVIVAGLAMITLNGLGFVATY